MTIDFYQMGGSPPCRAVLMTAKHLKIPLNVKNIDLQKGEHLTPEYLAINPLHVIPTIVDDGFHLWESRAIMTYLANKYAPDSSLYPKDPKARAQVDRILNFDIGTFYKALADNFYGPMFYGKPKDPEHEETFKKQLNVIETIYLKDNKYLAGNHVTLADLSLLAALTFVEVLGFDLSEYAKLGAWLKTLKSELPYHEEVNEVPLQAMKAFLKK